MEDKLFQTEEIQSLTNTENYRLNGRTNVFPTKASLDWFIRKHREHLVERKALTYPTRRKLIAPEKFDQYLSDFINE